MTTLINIEPSIWWSKVGGQLPALKFKRLVSITTWTVQAENMHVADLFQLTIKVAEVLASIGKCLELRLQGSVFGVNFRAHCKTVTQKLYSVIKKNLSNLTNMNLLAKKATIEPLVSQMSCGSNHAYWRYYKVQCCLILISISTWICKRLKFKINFGHSKSG